jgi:hypothetical protein
MSGHDEDTDVAVCHGVYGHEARAAHGQREGNTTQFPLPSHILAERGRSNSGSPKLTMSQDTLARFAPHGGRPRSGHVIGMGYRHMQGFGQGIHEQ